MAISQAEVHSMCKQLADMETVSSPHVSLCNALLS